ncbi:MAG: HAMP domain-containing protein [Desulfamplus sp.]|nr:HAMP domain-containing protein [Desulfamplus sp.]
MVKNMSLAKKQMGGFLLISMITVIVAATGIYGLKNTQEHIRSINMASPLIDAAMEMKISVVTDMLMLMEILSAPSQERLNAELKAHELSVKNFAIFSDAILNGAETEEGTIYASKDKAMRDIVEKASKIHKEEIITGINKISELVERKIAGEAIEDMVLDELDTKVDATGQELVEMIGEIEDMARASISNAESSAIDFVQSAITALLFTTVVALIFSIILGIVITRMIVKPMVMATKFAEQMSNGDMTQKIELEQTDEVGMLISSLNTMSSNLRVMFKDIANGVSTLTSASSDLTAISEQIKSNSNDSSNRSVSVAAASEEMSTTINRVASASEEAAGNVQLIVAAVEEMSSTIREIASNTSTASTITSDAVNQAESISHKVDELGRAAIDVGKVTETIAEISEQTNLLALNATIEAARAGEAGKGFAVVAAEIKELAKQTANSTQEINQKINTIQTNTHDAVSEIVKIVQVINNVNEIVTTIASAVEEQTVTTQEISSNLTSAAHIIGEVNDHVNQTSAVAVDISKDIADVSHAVKEITDGSSQINLNAKELSKLAKEINQMVIRFKV